MRELTDIIAEKRSEALEAYEAKNTPIGERLQVRVGAEYCDLVNRLAILMGIKRAEVVRLALDELSATIQPQLLEA